LEKPANPSPTKRPSKYRSDLLDVPEYSKDNEVRRKS
jgi:hypothetical protein